MKTKVLIVGSGVVGSALKGVFPARHYDAQFLDPPKNMYPPNGFTPDIIFVCVPTPSNNDGTCDGSMVIDVVKQFATHKAHLVIRSTVTPQIVEKLLDIRTDIIIMPEFITEKNAETDIKNPPMVPIGCLKMSCVKLILNQLQHSTMDLLKIKHCSPIEASAIKYLANCFLATKVVFMHEAQKWLTQQYPNDVDWNRIVDILKTDPRMGTSHFNSPGQHGYGFSGKCFPKDTLAFSTESCGALKLLNSVIESNAILRERN